MLVVREEKWEDWVGVFGVNEAAFVRPDEAELVERLREGGGIVLSLVGVLDGRIVGHVLFSPVVLEMEGGKMAEGVGLGPGRRRQGACPTPPVPPAARRTGGHRRRRPRRYCRLPR
jgi:putative acetyltransferase